MQDVAHVVWAEDDPALCAIRERGILCILRNGASMEQHAFTAHLCSFSSLEVQVRIRFEAFDVWYTEAGFAQLSMAVRLTVALPALET
jgi:hypothetical protein